MNIWLIWAIALAAVLALNIVIVALLNHADRRRRARLDAEEW